MALPEHLLTSEAMIVTLIVPVLPMYLLSNLYIPQPKIVPDASFIPRPIISVREALEF